MNIKELTIADLTALANLARMKGEFITMNELMGRLKESGATSAFAFTDDDYDIEDMIHSLEDVEVSEKRSGYTKTEIGYVYAGEPLYEVFYINVDNEGERASMDDTILINDVVVNIPIDYIL